MYDFKWTLRDNWEKVKYVFKSPHPSIIINFLYNYIFIRKSSRQGTLIDKGMCECGFQPGSTITIFSFSPPFRPSSHFLLSLAKFYPHLQLSLFYLPPITMTGIHNYQFSKSRKYSPFLLHRYSALKLRFPIRFQLLAILTMDTCILPRRDRAERKKIQKERSTVFKTFPQFENPSSFNFSICLARKNSKIQ